MGKNQKNNTVPIPLFPSKEVKDAFFKELKRSTEQELKKQHLENRTKSPPVHPSASKIN